MRDADAAVVHQRIAELRERAARGDHEHALAGFAEFLHDFGGSDDGWVAERVALVMLLQVISLRSLERVAEVVAGVDRLHSAFGRSSDPDARDHVARGLIIRGMALAGCDDLEGALASYDTLAAEYDQDRDSRIARRVTWAMWNSTTLLTDPGREAEREALYERVATRHVEGGRRCT